MRVHIYPSDQEKNCEITMAIVKQHIPEGATIHSDHGGNFNRTADEGYLHIRHNHSKGRVGEYRDTAYSESGISNIRRIWALLGSRVRARCLEEKLADALVRYKWEQA